MFASCFKKKANSTTMAEENRTHTNNKLSYRSELGGLRAIAVLVVISYHAGFKFCPGGSVGMDMFFVLSGYLMTGIILRELQQNTFTIFKFYERRVRRILQCYF